MDGHFFFFNASGGDRTTHFAADWADEAGGMSLDLACRAEVTPVPEPETLLLFLIALGVAAFSSCRA